MTKRTNKPGTCLFCGKRLTPNKTLQERVVDESTFGRLKQQRDRGTRSFYDGHRVVWLQKKPEGFTVGIDVPDGTFGKWNGFFHSDACAAQFGYAFALAGRRLAPEQSDA